MPKSTKRKNTRLHCQHCGQQRAMLQFCAINTEQKDDEKNVYHFHIKRFLDLIQSKATVKLPRYYAGTCAVCLKHTFFQGQNHGTKLEVIPT
jgi:ribosomal protein L44E